MMRTILHQSADQISIALPKGRLAEETLSLMGKAGLSTPHTENGRRLVVTGADGSLRFILAKPSDVATFVEYGAADLGVCGLDTLRESGRNVYEPLLLPFGRCRLSLAGPAGREDVPLRYESLPRVATKYPRIASEFFRARGINAEIIPLNGSVELAPLAHLADLVVDVVETGNTLRANGLAEYRVIMECQAVLIANRAAYRLKSGQIGSIIERLRNALASPPYASQ